MTAPDGDEAAAPYGDEAAFQDGSEAAFPDGAGGPAVRDGLVAAVLLALAIGALYGRTLGYPLLVMWDDNLYVTDQTHLLTPTLENLRYWLTTGHASNYIPLTMLTFVLDYLLWGLQPSGYRVQNLFWLWLTALAVYGCLKALGLRPVWALGLVLLFVVQPTRLESVVWISERKDVLAGAFYFAAIWLYIRRREQDPAAPVILLSPLLMAACSGLAKGMAITLPAVLALYEWQRGTGIRMIIRRLWPMGLISVGILGVTLWAQGDAAEEGVAIGHRFLVVARNLLWYAGIGLLPVGHRSALAPRLLFTPGVLAALAAAYALVGAALGLLWWRLREARPRRALVAGVLALPAIMLPVIGLAPIGAIDYADRYSYFSTPLILLGLGLLLQRLAADRPLRRVAAAAVLIALIGLSAHLFTRNVRQWRSDLALMRHAAAVDRPNPHALILLMAAQLRDGSYDDVIATADRLRAMGTADGLTPQHIAAYRLMADYQELDVHTTRGSWSRAEVLLLGLIRQQQAYSDPDFPSVAQLESRLGDIYRRTDRPRLALAAYRRAIAADPSLAPDLGLPIARAQAALPPPDSAGGE